MGREGQKETATFGGKGSGKKKQRGFLKKVILEQSSKKGGGKAERQRGIPTTENRRKMSHENSTNR